MPLTRRSVLLLALALQTSSFASAQNVPLHPSVENGKRMVRWNVAAGTVQIMRSTTLAPGSWVPAPTPKLLGGDWWEVEAPTNETRVFYKADPPAVPTLAPQNVRLVMDGDSFRLEWDSAHEAAGYVVYAGLDPNVGPSNYERRVVLGNANSMLIEGLTNGQAYYITIAHINPAGTGPVAVATRAVFGPNGTVSGTMRRTTPQQTGRAFEVEAQGANVMLTPVAAGVGAFVPQGVSDERGVVSIAHVPVGEYYVDWAWGSENGRRVGTITVTPKGTTFGTINVSPPVTGTALFGTLRMADGMLPAVDHEAFNLRLRATVTAIAVGGSQVSMTPDTHGRWLFQGLPPSAFPVTLRATLAGLSVEQIVPSPPAQPQRIPLVFTQRPPRVVKVRTKQNGQEVQSVQRGLPTTLEAEIENPDGVTTNPRWTVEYGGETHVFNTPTPTIAFDPPPSGTTQNPTPTGETTTDGGIIRIRVSAADVSEDVSFVDRSISSDQPTQPDGYAGEVRGWDPLDPDYSFYAQGSSITITPGVGAPVVSAIPGSYYEMDVNATSSPPYLVRVEKEGYMRFLWPFSTRLPNEPRFYLMPTQTSTHHLHATQDLVISYAGNGAKITLPPGSLLDSTGAVHTGDFTASLVSLDPGVRHPFPPGAEVHKLVLGAIQRTAMKWMGLFWISIKDLNGAPLTPTAGATLTLPVNTSQGTPTTYDLAVQNDATGWFNDAGTVTEVNGPIAGIYTAPLTQNGLHIVYLGGEPNTIEIEADRTLNYPFDVLVGGSFFPVTVRGLSTHSLGAFTLPVSQTVRLKVLALNQAPGIYDYYPNTSAAYNYASFEKNVITEKIISPAASTTDPTDAPAFKATLSLGDTVTEIASHVGDISGKSFFLDRQKSTKADSDAYYAKIKAPATLLEWRRLNGFPDAFGAPMPNVPVERYATTYYYNLTDLGFARAQTMRMRPGINGVMDVAFQVTNYPTLEDARLGSSVIATVCMDYAARFDDGESNPKRYTRFYVYDAAGFLIGGADLDGAGKKKFVPNSCTMCHGGSDYTAGGTTNLGARFLPFDLHAYSYHPKWLYQNVEFAKMNEAVLQTKTTAAIEDLIAGWYGNASPNAAPLEWLFGHTPSAPGLSWSETPDQESAYATFSSSSCRVCHVSREVGNAQFDSYAAFEGWGFGGTSTQSLEMPQAQRSWGIFWGSRGHNLLDPIIGTDAPTSLFDRAGIAIPWLDP